MNRPVPWIALPLVTLFVLVSAACSGGTAKAAGAPKTPVTVIAPDDAAVALFAGGCFWCVESSFQELDGVYTAVSGYTGGPEKNPTYKQVSSGRTGHTEALEVKYDASLISYTELLDVFWRSMDPTDAGGQFADRGSQYRPAIYFLDEDQQQQAERSKRELMENGPFQKPIIVPILPAGPFHVAEEYHQDYYLKNPDHYYAYRKGSGRTGFLERTWGKESHAKPASFVKPSSDELRKTLSPLQYKVTQENGTEAPFRNEYWDNKKEGIYVDVVSGEVLFSSNDKFKSGTGWPSFTRPLKEENIVSIEDRTHGMLRTEVRSRNANGHLGHLFPDGPQPTGDRYCINSASLRFIPRKQMKAEGYAAWFGEFEKK